MKVYELSTSIIQILLIKQLVFPKRMSVDFLTYLGLQQLQKPDWIYKSYFFQHVTKCIKVLLNVSLSALLLAIFKLN